MSAYFVYIIDTYCGNIISLSHVFPFSLFLIGKKYWIRGFIKQKYMLRQDMKNNVNEIYWYIFHCMTFRTFRWILKLDQSLWRPQRIFLLPDICRELWLNLEKFQTRPGLHAFRTKTKRDYNGYEDRWSDI